MAVLALLVDGVAAQKFEIEESITIGRLPQNDVMVNDASVSSQHAVVERKSNPDFPTIVEYFIRDLGSTNGTEVNDKKISGVTQLHHQDEIKIAWNMFKFFDENEINLTKTAHILT